jgi:hypothetical protein
VSCISPTELHDNAESSVSHAVSYRLHDSRMFPKHPRLCMAELGRISLVSEPVTETLISRRTVAVSWRVSSLPIYAKSLEPGCKHALGLTKPLGWDVSLFR